MLTNQSSTKTHRRGFLGLLAGSAAALGLSALTRPVNLQAAPLMPSSGASAAELWIDKIKGSHKVVFDVTQPHEIFPFAWPRVFLITNGKTGVPETDCGVVVVLRHSAIAYAFEDKLWNEYKFGELFGADDPQTKQPALRNPFWQPKPGEFKVPGIGEVAIGINELQESGVMFCVCEMAMTVYSAVAGDKMKKDPAAIKAEWLQGMLPGIQSVPSGVWAIGRAQEKGCAYVFAG